MNLDYSRVLDEHGEPAGVIAIVVKTTMRVLTERRTEAILLSERAQSELRDQFIAILGHDLRNPLQAIFATGGMLKSKLTDPTQFDMAVRMQTNVRRMSALIDDAYDFARGKSGGGVSVVVPNRRYGYRLEVGRAGTAGRSNYYRDLE